MPATPTTRIINISSAADYLPLATCPTITCFGRLVYVNVAVTNHHFVSIKNMFVFFVCSLLLLFGTAPLTATRIAITQEFQEYLEEHELKDHIEEFQRSGVLLNLYDRMKSGVPPAPQDFVPIEIRRASYQLAKATPKEIEAWLKNTNDTAPEESTSEESEEETMREVIKLFRTAVLKMISDPKHRYRLNMTMDSFFSMYLKGYDETEFSINALFNHTTSYPPNHAHMHDNTPSLPLKGTNRPSQYFFPSDDPDVEDFLDYLRHLHFNTYSIEQLMHLVITDDQYQDYGRSFVVMSKSHIKDKLNVTEDGGVDKFILNLLKKDAQLSTIVDDFLIEIFFTTLGEVIHVVEAHFEVPGTVDEL